MSEMQRTSPCGLRRDTNARAIIPHETDGYDGDYRVSCDRPAYVESVVIALPHEPSAAVAEPAALRLCAYCKTPFVPMTTDQRYHTIICGKRDRARHAREVARLKATAK